MNCLGRLARAVAWRVQDILNLGTRDPLLLIPIDSPIGSKLIHRGPGILLQPYTGKPLLFIKSSFVSHLT